MLPKFCYFLNKSNRVSCVNFLFFPLSCAKRIKSACERALWEFELCLLSRLSTRLDVTLLMWGFLSTLLIPLGLKAKIMEFWYRFYRFYAHARTSGYSLLWKVSYFYKKMKCILAIWEIYFFIFFCLLFN